MKKIILIFTFIIVMPNFIWASENLYWSNSKTGPSTIDEAKRRFGNRFFFLEFGITQVSSPITEHRVGRPI